MPLMVIWKSLREQEIVDDTMPEDPEVIFLIDFQVADVPDRVSRCYKRDTMLELVLVAILHFGAANKAGYRIEGINEETLVRMIVPPSCRIFCKDKLAGIAIETHDSTISAESAALSSAKLLLNCEQCAEHCRTILKWGGSGEDFPWCRLESNLIQGSCIDER